eukprot:3130590-Pyramimonas_sp.AAC.1
MENGVKLASLGCRSGPPLEAALTWRRYVDDVMSFIYSLCYCPGCRKGVRLGIHQDPLSPDGE